MSKITVGGNATFNGINFKGRNIDIRVRRKKGRIIHITNYTFPTKITETNKKGFLSKVHDLLSYTPFLRGPYLLATQVKKGWKMMLSLYITFFALLLGIVYLSPTAQQYMLSDKFVTQADVVLPSLFIIFVLIFFNMSPVAKYHGAEHKAINTVRSGKIPTLGNIKKASRVSRSCGTVYLTFFLLIFIPLALFIDLVLAFLIALSVGFELFLAEQKWLTSIFKPVVFIAIGFQKYVTTREPNDKHLEVAQSGIWHIYKAHHLNQALEDVKGGRFESGDKVIDRFLETEKENNPITQFYKANSLYYQGKYAEALDYINAKNLTKSKISPRLIDNLIADLEKKASK